MFPDSQKMCYISMLVSYVCILFLSKSFLIALLQVTRSQQSCDIILINVFKLQGLPNCCIRIIILIINIFLYAKHLLNIKRVYIMNISKKSLILSKKRGLNTLLNQKPASSRELMISKGMLSRDSVKCKQFRALQSEYPKGHVSRRLR